MMPQLPHPPATESAGEAVGGERWWWWSHGGVKWMTGVERECPGWWSVLVSGILLVKESSARRSGRRMDVRNDHLQPRQLVY